MSTYERRVLTTTDRTHWTDPSGATVLPSTSITFNSDKKYYFTEPLALDIIDGNDYEVTWSGERYNAPAATMTIYGEECVYLGNKTGLDASPDLNQGSFLLIVLPESMRDQGYAELIALDGYSSANVEIVCVSENVHFLDKKYLANANGDMAHKMLVTDGNEKAKWEERTHYTYRGTGYIVPLTTFLQSDVSNFGIIIKTPAILENGETYTVTWNGVEYPCVATVTPAKPILEGLGITVDDSVMGGLLGNMGVLDPSMATSEPFALMMFQGTDLSSNKIGEYGRIIPLDDSTTGSFSIQGISEMVKTVDEKYLPDRISKKIDIILQDNNCFANVSFDEAWALSERDLQKAISFIDASRNETCAVSNLSKIENILGKIITFFVAPFTDEHRNSHLMRQIVWGYYPSAGVSGIGLGESELYSPVSDMAEWLQGKGLTLESVSSSQIGHHLAVMLGEGLHFVETQTVGNPKDAVALTTMSETTKGGAMVGTGLEVVDGYLNVKPISSDRINEICGSTTT